MEIEDVKVESILSKYKKIRDQILAEPDVNPEDFQLPTDYDNVFFPDKDKKFVLKSADSQKSIALFSNGISSKLILKTPEFNQLSRDVEQNLVENHLKIGHLENCLDLTKNANLDKFNNIIQHYDEIFDTAKFLRTQIDAETHKMDCAFDKMRSDISNIQDVLIVNFNTDFEKIMKNFDTLPKLDENDGKVILDKIISNKLKNVKFQLPDETNEINNFNNHIIAEEDLKIPASIQSILKESERRYNFKSSIEKDRKLPQNQVMKFMIPEIYDEKDIDVGPYITKETNDVDEPNVEPPNAKDFRIPLEKQDIINEISAKYSKAPNKNINIRKNAKISKIKFRK